MGCGCAAAQTPKPDVLTEDEADQLRDQQDPGARIELYLNFAQVRLDLFENFRSQSHDPKYDNGGYLDQVLAQYIAIDIELKDWIQDQYDRQGDLRKACEHSSIGAPSRSKSFAISSKLRTDSQVLTEII